MIARAIAKHDHIHKSHSKDLLHTIFSELHPTPQGEGDNYSKFLQMDKEYCKVLKNLDESESNSHKSVHQIAYENHQKEALGY